MNIPSFEETKFVDEKGFLTPIVRQMMLQLFQTLQTNASNEGLVAPTQTSANISTIVGNTLAPPAPANTYTCQYGTILYNSTANSMMMAINNGSGAPVFKTVTLT